MIRKTLAATAILASCSNTVFADESWRETALTLANEEAKVRDALWSQDISFWIAVDDDGTDRSGYAQYICLLLSQAGRPQGEFVSVTVWDYASMATQSPKRLGRANCP
ncbi:MAG: hypothetical protein NXH91_12180 [Phyllobacteriaceae bacterium]|nr:hypothetical protein [Phyllobacteriaceae bacterium]